MEPISNASLRMDVNIDAMNKAKEVQQNAIMPLLESNMQQQATLAQDQQVSQTVAQSLGMGISLDIKA